MLTYENAKTKKGENLGYLTGILYLAPADSLGDIIREDGFADYAFRRFGMVYTGTKSVDEFYHLWYQLDGGEITVNTCGNETPGCKAGCLFSAGRGGFDSVKWARAFKTLLWRFDRTWFTQELHAAIKRGARKADRAKLKFAVRLNGTSDLDWTPVIRSFPGIQFYDYTPNAARVLKTGRPANYHLTYSRKEGDADRTGQVLQAGYNVAIVYKDRKAADTWGFGGAGQIDGDAHDLRFLDKASFPGNIVALIAKGRAKRDGSGFVVG